MHLRITCLDCGIVLPHEWVHDSEEHSCPNCTSIWRNVIHEIANKAALHDNLRSKSKDQNFPSKQKCRVKIFTGSDLRKSDSKWMKKEQIIDKDRNYYKEKITDPKTGEIVHHDEGPLSEHQGHGTVKLKRDNV